MDPCPEAGNAFYNTQLLPILVTLACVFIPAFIVWVLRSRRQDQAPNDRLKQGDVVRIIKPRSGKFGDLVEVQDGYKKNC